MKLGVDGSMDRGMRNVLVDRDGPVLIVTINRMEKYNAIHAEMRNELALALAHVQEDRSIRAVILWGGTKGFMGGADVNELLKRRPLEVFSPMSRSADVWSLFSRCPVPVIAAVAGLAVGGGNELAMACDLRVAADNAMFAQPEVNMGLLPGRGGTQRLPRLVRMGRAKELVLTGSIIKAEEAMRIGLVNGVVPVERLLDEAMNLARTVASKSPVAVQMAKLMLDAGQDVSLDTALLMESLAFATMFTTEGMREGVTAFLEKRTAFYSDR